MSDLVNSPSAAIGAYCLSSIVMTLGNKFVLSGKHFNLNCVVLAIQSLSCLAVIHVLKYFGLVSFRKFSHTDAKKWFPVSALLVAMIYTASKAIQYLSVPVFTIFKNLTIILIAYGEVLWFNGTVTPMIMGSFVLIVLSSVVAAWSDVSAAAEGGVSIVGYVWMFSNCFSQAAFVLFLRKRIKVLGFKDMDTMFYNNLISIPILGAVSLLTEDWSSENVSLNFPEDSRSSVIMMMVITGLLSVGISYCSGWCVRVTSSTTYSMVGALNKLPIAIFGLVFFDSQITFMKVFSIFLGFLAGLVYSLAKVQQQKGKEQSLPK